MLKPAIMITLLFFGRKLFFPCGACSTVKKKKSALINQSFPLPSSLPPPKAARERERGVTSCLSSHSTFFDATPFSFPPPLSPLFLGHFFSRKMRRRRRQRRRREQSGHVWWRLPLPLSDSGVGGRPTDQLGLGLSLSFCRTAKRTTQLQTFFPLCLGCPRRRRKKTKGGGELEATHRPTAA